MRKVTFYIHYNTQWGEELHLALNNDRSSAVKMTFTPGCVWMTTLQFESGTRQLHYRYLVKCGGRIVREELCAGHVLSLDDGIAHCHVEDCWDDNCANTVGVILCADDDCRVALQPGQIVMEVLAPLRDHHHRLALVGAAEALGGWNVKRAIALQPVGEGLWRASISMPACDVPTPFKFILTSTARRSDVVWEQGDNRWLRHVPHADEVTVLAGLRFRNQQLAWKRVATLVSLAMLRSERDMGCGDLGDLRKLLQWAHAAGQDAIMLTGLGDQLGVVQGWMPEHLRQLVTKNAIDAAYLRLSMIATLADRKLKAQYQREGLALNAMEQAPLEQVRRLKLDAARHLMAQMGSSVVRSHAFRHFVRENSLWLKPFAAQQILQQINGNNAADWGVYQRYDSERVERFLKGHHREAEFIYFVQYHLRQQLLKAVDFAKTLHISLLCDGGEPLLGKPFDACEPWTLEKQIERRLRDAGEGLSLVSLREWLMTESDFAARLAALAQDKRLPISLEELVAASDFNHRLAALVQRAVK